MTEYRTGTEPHRDHLWVLFILAALGLAEVWASWVLVGSMSGFPSIAHIPTNWILAATTEGYSGYALFAWLAGAPGRRSRRFAMWSAAGMFALSVAGQSAGHLTRHGTALPAFAVVFVTSLPLISVALIAILIHLRQKDREETAETARQAAGESELAMVRGELAEARQALQTMRAELRATCEEAESRVAEATAKTEALARKLAALQKAGAGRRRARKQPGNGSREPVPVTGQPEAGGEGDGVDREALVLKFLAEGRTASEAGRLAGLTDSRGRQIARKLAEAAPSGPDGGPS